MLIFKNLTLEYQLQFEITIGQAQASPSECKSISSLHGSDKQMNKTNNRVRRGKRYV